MPEPFGSGVQDLIRRWGVGGYRVIRQPDSVDPTTGSPRYLPPEKTAITLYMYPYVREEGDQEAVILGEGGRLFRAVVIGQHPWRIKDFVEAEGNMYVVRGIAFYNSHSELVIELADKKGVGIESRNWN